MYCVMKLVHLRPYLVKVNACMPSSIQTRRMLPGLLGWPIGPWNGWRIIALDFRETNLKRYARQIVLSYILMPLEFRSLISFTVPAAGSQRGHVAATAVRHPDVCPIERQAIR